LSTSTSRSGRRSCFRRSSCGTSTTCCSFGSDYPVITPDRWLKDFESLPIKAEIRPLVLKDNAVQLLGLR